MTAPASRPARLLYGPHCSHHDLCSMFGCDQRGHIDYPCREEATCTYCGPEATCPMDGNVSAAECPDCYVGGTMPPPPMLGPHPKPTAWSHSDDGLYGDEDADRWDEDPQEEPPPEEPPWLDEEG